ncbi:MAG: hypothetical protein LBQ03_01670 [Puniceicoccales bacterium]|nr:hypothetical protein [Puniceicoccales bacterium]
MILKNILFKSRKALLFLTTGLFLSTAHGVRRIWTEEEDAKLELLVREYEVGNWAAIARAMARSFPSKDGNHRTGNQCSQRWECALNPKINRGPWTEEEDEELIRLVGELGESNWAAIAEAMAQLLPSKDGNHRTGPQCRARWMSKEMRAHWLIRTHHPLSVNALLSRPTHFPKVAKKLPPISVLLRILEYPSDSVE